MIRNPAKSPFWGTFGLPTIWVRVCECLSLRVLHYNRHPHHPRSLPHQHPHQQQQQKHPDRIHRYEY